jgi:2-oxoacid:acceptor oxidoreductase delta subunit (pyruvate/2-ketoisovalerate family)
MERKNILGPDRTLSLDYMELPIGASAIGFNPNLIKTGTWRFVRPVMRPMMAPCNEACPAGVDVRGFIGFINNGLVQNALELYLDENPLPAICGRVCFHPCESACNRAFYDEAVAINGLENFIGDCSHKNPPCLDDNGMNIAVIGSGPAGLSCAYFLRRLGYSVKIFEKEPKPGGVLRYYIPEYRLPKKILDREIQKLTAMGIDIQTNKNLGQNTSVKELNPFDALFFATGAHVPVRPGIPGEKADGVYLGLDFLKRVSAGNRKAFKKRVIVIGGGNTAIDVARTILRLGGKPAIYYRRTIEEMPAMESEVSDCKREGIKINYLTTPIKILSKQNKVAGVEFVRNELGERDGSNRRVPVPVKGTNFRVDADAVILAVGEGTDLSPFLGFSEMEQQLLKINESGRTSNKKIFAGGDVTHYQRTVVDAIKSGKRAAIGIDCHLGGINEKEIFKIMGAVATNQQGALSFHKYIQKDFSSMGIDGQVIHFEELNTSYFQHDKRNKQLELPFETRIKNFKEVRRGFTSKKAQKEATRCFSCGLCNTCGNCFIFCPDSSISFDEDETKMLVDYDYCKGCGICIEECPRHAIRIMREE